MKLISCLVVLAVLLTTVSPLNAAEVTLAWDAPTGCDPAPCGPLGYKIHQGTESGKYTKVVDAGKLREIVMQGLLAGTTYYWAATAVYPVGESGFSNEVSKSIPAVALPIPVVVAANADGKTTSFTFDTGNAVPTRYLIKLIEAPGIPGTDSGTLYEGTKSPIVLTTLTQGKTYNFYGRYNVDDAVSPRSAQGSITIPTVLNLKAPALLIIKVE